MNWSEQASALDGGQLPAVSKIMCRVCIDGHTPRRKIPACHGRGRHPFEEDVDRRARICVRPTNALLAESTDGTLTDSWVDGRGHIDVNRPPDQRTPMDRPPDRVGTRAPSVRLTSRHARDTTRPIAKVTSESHLTALNGTNSRPKQ